MALQGIMSFEGIKHRRFSSIHRRRASLDGDQLGHRPVVGVNGQIQELPGKMEERMRLNDNSNCEEEQQQLKKSVWDCESSLYDSFELYTFSRQLNRAMAATSTLSPVVNNYQLIGGFRSLSLPHYVSTKSSITSTEWQYLPVNVEKEEINLQEEKSMSQTVEQSEVERQIDTRQILKRHSRKMGFPRSVQRLFTRLFHKKGRSSKLKNTMEAEADDPYYNHHSRGAYRFMDQNLIPRLGLPLNE